MDKNKGFISLMIAAILFSSQGVLVRELENAFGTLTQVGTRYGVAFCILLLIILLKKYSLQIPKKNRLPLLIFSITAPISAFFFALSILSIKASNSIFSLYIGSLIVTFISGTLIFRESLTKFKILSLAAVLIGLILIAYPFSFQTGLVYGLLAGFFDGSTNTLRKTLGKLRREVIIFYQYGMATLLLLGSALLSSETMVAEISTTSILAISFFGASIVATGILVTYGFNHFDVNIGTVVLISELFFALIINHLLLHEHPTGFELLGAFFIFIAAILANIRPATKKEPIETT